MLKSFSLAFILRRRSEIGIGCPLNLSTSKLPAIKELKWPVFSFAKDKPWTALSLSYLLHRPLCRRTGLSNGLFYRGAGHPHSY
jgi:hypothetical protein